MGLFCVQDALDGKVDGLVKLGRAISSSTAVSQQAQQAAPQPEMIEVFVNDQPIQIPKGSTVMAACDAAGIDIPRLTSV